MHRSSLSLRDGMYFRHVAALIFVASVTLCVLPALGSGLLRPLRHPVHERRPNRNQQPMCAKPKLRRS